MIHPLTMPHAHVHSPVDEAASLRREEIAAAKHEFAGGEIDAMAGASEQHKRGTRLTLDDLYEDTGLLVV